MQIRRSRLFKEQFRHIVLHIAKDKKSATKDFKNSLNSSINNLQNFPYKDETIRDLTFKTYIIIYRIDELKELIEILEIFHKNLPTKKEK